MTNLVIMQRQVLEWMAQWDVLLTSIIKYISFQKVKNKIQDEN